MSFNIPTIIERKRNGGELSKEEIDFIVKSIAEKQIHYAQLGAMLMAMFLKGMTATETVHLTKCMVDHGDSLQWPESWKHLVADKHSTGGVGDKVSLPLAPTLASFGLKIPMISGRGLGFTGGTLDKLESIPGFNVNFTTEQIVEAVSTVGCCIVSQTGKIVPADKEMYAIRDVTATVPSLPLITSSIISKKAAESLSSLVLDVKCGSGAFMKTEPEARQLGQWLVNISTGLGIKTSAVLTKMEQPIGLTIGNSVEVIESIECLRGRGPGDLRELVCLQGGHLLFSAGKVSSTEEGIAAVNKALDDGSGLKKFKEMLIVQGVASEIAEKLCDPCSDLYQILPIAKIKTELKAEEDSIVLSYNALEFAKLLVELGAGRMKPGETIDHGVGLVLQHHPGEFVKKGDSWGVIYHSQPLSQQQKDVLQNAVTFKLGTKQNEQALETRLIDVIQPNNI